MPPTPHSPHANPFATYLLYLMSRWFLVAFALLLAAWLIPGVVIESLYISLVTAALLGLMNLIVRPVLLLLTIPITVMTLGLFILVLNGLVFWFVASFVEGFEVSGLLAAIGGALTVSVVSYIGDRALTAQYYPDRS